MKRCCSRHSHNPHQCKFCGKRAPEPRLETRRTCPYCKKELARQCVYEHMKWHCPKNPHRKKKRTFKKKLCPDCGKKIHEKSFSRHRRSHSKKKKTQA